MCHVMASGSSRLSSMIIPTNASCPRGGIPPEATSLQPVSNAASSEIHRNSISTCRANIEHLTRRLWQFLRNGRGPSPKSRGEKGILTSGIPGCSPFLCPGKSGHHEACDRIACFGGGAALFRLSPWIGLGYDPDASTGERPQIGGMKRRTKTM